MNCINSFQEGQRSPPFGVDHEVATSLIEILECGEVLCSVTTFDAELQMNEALSNLNGPSVIVFDVNETLIDIESLEPFFQKLFGDGRVLREWFNQLVLYSNVITFAGYYETFFTLGQGILQMLGSIYGVRVGSTEVEALRVQMLSMPAHEDVRDGLTMLKNAGFRLMTLTNSPPDRNGSPLERAGLASLIERQFSVDSIRRFKPAPEVYHLVAEQLNLSTSAICMVAAHTWDTLGAQSVGFAAGLVTRSGNAPLLVEGLPQPQIIAPDLREMARQIVTLWR